MIYFLFILLFLSVIFEGTLTALPLVLICLLCMTILTRDTIIFVAAFLSGIFLDAFALRPLGETSLFLVTVVLLVFLYQRKYEIYSYQFVMVASLLGGWLFLTLFGYPASLLYAVFSAVIAACGFAVVRLLAKTDNAKQERGTRQV